MFHLMVAIVCVASLLSACERAPAAAAASATMKSATYYGQHLQEAAQVALRCKQLNEQRQRALDVPDYQEWQMSNESINCQTATSVTDAASLRDALLQSARPLPAAASAVRH